MGNFSPSTALLKIIKSDMAIRTNTIQAQSTFEEVQEATAKTIAETRMKDIGQIQTFYIVKAEDPSIKEKFNCYLTIKMAETSFTLNFNGVEVNKTQLKNALNKSSIGEYVKERVSDIISIRLPWTKIINIQEVKNKQNKV